MVNVEGSAGTGGVGATGATGAPAPLIAAQYNMRTDGQGSTINDKQNIPYQKFREHNRRASSRL